MKKYCFVIIFQLICAFSILAQSTNIEYPTPISSGEINGKISARDIGDSRLTSHYYVFDGKQGDIFIDIETNNLNGDIDVFVENGLKPLTKISLFAENTPTQTGRELYLRKAERMILKIEGRSPNDDPATYKIKFSGSFVTIAKNSVKEEPKAPRIKTETDSDVVVNSVGTIIETKVKEPEPEKVAKTTKPKSSKIKNTKSEPASTPKADSTIKPKTSTAAKNEPKTKPIKKETEEQTVKPEVVVTDNLPKNTAKGESVEKEPAPKTTTAKKTTASKKNTSVKNTKNSAATKKAQQNEEIAKALENIKLVVLFKDGATLESAMTDVLRFGVDKGILTIVKKDGSIGRYSIVEISKISVE